MQVNIIMRRVQEDITLRVMRPEDFVSEMESEFVNHSDNPTLDDFYHESGTADRVEYWETFLCEEPDSECVVFGPDDWEWLKETMQPYLVKLTTGTIVKSDNHIRVVRRPQPERC